MNPHYVRPSVKNICHDSICISNENSLKVDIPDYYYIFVYGESYIILLFLKELLPFFLLEYFISKFVGATPFIKLFVPTII